MLSKEKVEQFKIEGWEYFLKEFDRVDVYLKSLDWIETYSDINFVRGWGSIITIFLVDIRDEEGDDKIYVIIGDIPTAYLNYPIGSSYEILEEYVRVMSDWANKVLNHERIEECFPVRTKATEENARDLIKRLNFISENLIY